MAVLRIRNGRVVDPARNLDAVGDVWIVDGRFAPKEASGLKYDQALDATGMIVMPGFVDAHVHLREPGNEASETIETGCAAALAGGFTSIICMPNTTPVLDTPERVQFVLDKAAALEGPHVYAMAAITQAREGKRLTDFDILAAAGAVAFTDDGNGVQDKNLIRKAMERAAALGLPIVEHCEDARLSAGGVMRHGMAAQAAGLPGIPPEAESAMVSRDITLSALTGARLHLQHISVVESVDLIRAAKVRGARVTAEVTPHHLTLTDEDAVRGGPNFKMNPPLSTRRDRDALVEAFRSGTLEMVATDHAPHTDEAKAKGFAAAPFGVIGMETAAAVIWTHFVSTHKITALQMATRMCLAPAEAFELDAGTLVPGRPADLVIFNPSASWTVDPEQFRSRSRNCPFAGQELQGRVVTTIVGGEVRYRADIH